MSLSSFIARRYFLARSSSNAVNIITGVSVTGILVGTAALIIVLSAFNGLEQLVRGMYQSFDPDLKITPHTGKFFNHEDLPSALWEDERIAASSLVLEEKALLTYRDKEFIATLKGVDQNYDEVTAITDYVQAGEYALQNHPSRPPAFLGTGIGYHLRYSKIDLPEPLNVFIPRNNQSMDPSKSFRSERIFPQGIFAIQPEFDEKYCLVPLPFMRKLLDRKTRVSGVEIRLKDVGETASFQKEWRPKLGNNFDLKNRDEQQAVFFKVMKSEGFFTFLIFALILSIATFTIAGSLTMLMFEKRANLATLYALGMTLPGLRRIFFKEGMIISLSGGGVGLVLGIIVILLQQHFGLISIGEGYIIDSYPVELAPRHILLVSATVLSLSALVSWLTTRRLTLELIHPSTHI